MKKLSLPFILMTAALLLAACSPAPAQPAAVAADPQPEVLIVAGRLQPAQSLAQSFSIPGQVAEVLVKDGEQVEVGQVLARLSSSPEAQLALARAQQELLNAQQALNTLDDAAESDAAADELARAQARLARLAAEEALEKAQDNYENDDSDLNKARLDEAAAQLKLAEETEARLSKNDGDRAAEREALEARLVSAQAGLASAQAAIAAAELKATLAGTVVDAELLVGQKVTAGQPVFTVADFSSWVVKTDNLTEVDVVNVEVGQQVSVVFDALPGQTMSGEVTHINRLFEEKRGDITYTVSAVLSQSDPQLRWGMTAAIAFEQ